MTSILALDSSSENCSVALYHQQTMFELSEHAPRKHTQLILPLAQSLLARQETALSDLGAIAFGAGPGSFTGIRIAAGVAQGLAYGLDVPIYAISNLKALALQSYLKHGVSCVLSCLDARMSEVYWGLFKVSIDQDDTGPQADTTLKRYRVDALGPERVGAPETVNLSLLDQDNADIGIAGVGSGLDLLNESVLERLNVVDSQMQPSADAIAYLADTAIFNGEAGQLSEALPSYVRDTVTWNKLPGRD
ncbi:MAG: tRNA (adenosine(37)-N6)-threonylcarbamoyltransferase complex dimerization subunit type 1 TsaB [Oleiphilus sp.]